MKQLAMRLPQRGGKRKGAGRKRTSPRPRVSHKRRAQFDKAAPVLVTLRVAFGVWNLRSRRCFRIIEDCFAGARDRFGLRVIEFSVLGNHLHLVVEADSDLALSRGMQGLGVRIARALNRLMKRRGRVFEDHYHSRLLGSPTQLVNAIAYVLGNHAHHLAVRLPRGIRSALLHTTWYDARRSCRAREPGFYVMAGVAHVGSRRGSPGGL